MPQNQKHYMSMKVKIENRKWWSKFKF